MHVLLVMQKKLLSMEVIRLIFFLLYKNCKSVVQFRITCFKETLIYFQVELRQLQSAYKSLVQHKNKIFCQRLWYIVLEQFLMKYVWSGTGMVMVSLPLLMANGGSKVSGNFINMYSE